MSAYVLADFISACAVNGAVMVSTKALGTARSDFNLKTEPEVLGFIFGGGLERPRHFNTKPWANNRDPSTTILVDAYEFHSGRTYGYIAFLFQPKTQKWIVKSFKKNRNPDPSNFALADAFLRAGYN